MPPSQATTPTAPPVQPPQPTPAVQPPPPAVAETSTASLSADEEEEPVAKQPAEDVTPPAETAEEKAARIERLAQYLPFESHNYRSRVRNPGRSKLYPMKCDMHMDFERLNAE